jgi:hypothetical protein
MYGVMQNDSSFASILVAHFRGKKGGLEKLLAHLIMLQQRVDSQTRYALITSFPPRTYRLPSSCSSFLCYDTLAFRALECRLDPNLDRADVRE